MLLKRIALSLASIVVTLGVAELALRLFDPLGISYQDTAVSFLDLERGAVVAAEAPLGYRLRPGHVYQGGFTSHVNSLSLRGRETSEKKPSGTFRVLFVGDSNTFGLGVDDEECFAALVEKDLHEGGRPDVEVLNGGCPGYDVVQEAHWIKKYGLALEPDLIVVVFVPGDPPRCPTAEEIAKRDALRATWTGRFLRSEFGSSLALKRLIRHVCYIRLQRAGELERMIGVGGFGQNAESERAYFEILDKARKQCEAKGVALAMLAGSDRAWLRAGCVERSIPYEPVLAGDQDAMPAEMRLSAEDAHPNAKGHRFVADCALRLLRDHALLEGRRAPK